MSQPSVQRFRVTETALPYIDNLRTVSITLLLNLLLTWVLRLDRYGVRDIVVDAVICALLTVVIDVVVVWRRMKKLRVAGALPTEVPVSKLMMLLPKSPFGLIVTFGIIFAVLCAGFNYSVFTWYGFQQWTLSQFMFYKLIYSLILSERIVSLCIFRLVQPDCKGTEKEQTVSRPVKNPLPTVSGLYELFSTVSANLALQLYSNPYIGEYTIGGARSIIAEGVIASTVTCLIVVGMITKTLDHARRNEELNVPPNRWLMFLPKNRWLFALLCALAAGPAAGFLFWGVFKLYGVTSWTFYEFFWIKMAYLTLLSKILVAFSLRRFTQPDIV